MKWLAKINLGIVIERLGAFKSALLILSVVGLALFSGYRLGNYYQHFQLTNLEQQKQRLEQLYQQQEDQVARIHTLEVELTVEQLANKKAQESLKDLAQEHFDAKKQLAFYEKVMAPEKQTDGLLIENIKLVAGSAPNQFQFQVTLVQQQLKRRYSKGYIDLTFEGLKADKVVKVKLKDIAKISTKDLKFSFQYFQIIRGEFTFPQDFIPKHVSVTAVLTQSRWQKYAKKEQRIPWQVSL